MIHCITRLRFYLKEEMVADTAAIQELDGVAGLACPVGNWLKDYFPASIRSIFQPLFTIFIVGAVVLVGMGLVITSISASISFVVNQLMQFNYVLPGLIIGGTRNYLTRSV